MPIHDNSIAAFYGFDHDSREVMVIKAFTDRSYTDREVMNLLGFVDMNTVRPCITKLVKQGVLEEIGTVVCQHTKRAVRVTRVVPRERYAKKAAKKPAMRLGPKAQAAVDAYEAAHPEVSMPSFVLRAILAYIKANP